MGAPEQQQGSSAPTHHNNGVVVTPLLHDDEQLPPSSIPAGYPQSNQQGATLRDIVKPWHACVLAFEPPRCQTLVTKCSGPYAGWTTQPAAPQSQEEPRKFFNETSYAGLQQGQPAPVVQGMQAGPMSTDQPLFCPATQDGPTFLGATVGHHQIPIQCGACGYQGPSHVM